MDNLGNRIGTIEQRDGDHTYAAASPNLTNCYASIDSVSLAYDDAGNLTQDKSGYHYVYDYENRITRIYNLSGQTEIGVAGYAYDALGRRIKKVDAIAAKTIYYTYNDNWQILAEDEVGQTSHRCYVYGNYIDEVIGRFSDESFRFPYVFYIKALPLFYNFPLR